MKRFLSITLCVMMVASLFAVNVSAAIPTTSSVTVGGVDEIVYFTQDYSDATKTDFTLRNYDGVVSVEDGVIHMTGREEASQFADTYGTSAIDSGSYVYEFDFMRNDDLTADYVVKVTFNRAANASNAALVRYGVVIPVRTVGMYEDENGVRWEDATEASVDIEAKKWYNFRITVDESKFVNDTSTYHKNGWVKVERKLSTENAWTALGYSTGNNFPASTVRVYGNAIDNGNVSNVQENSVAILGVDKCPNAQGITATGYVYDEAQGTYVTDSTKTYAEDGTTVDFQFDNIKCYVPAVPGEVVTRDLPIKQGVVLTRETEVEKASVGSTIYDSVKINWPSEPSKVVTTFDAVCTVAGGPLSFATAGLNVGSAMTTIAPGTIGQWYNFKIIYSSTGVSASALTVDAVYRKAEGSSEWTLLTKAPDSITVDGYDWWQGYNGSSSYNNIRWYLYGGFTKPAQVSSNCAAGTTWKVKNLQVSDGNAVTGTATVADGNLTLALNTELWSAADVIVATYNGDKLANVSYAPVAITGNTANITVPYTAGNTVKLYAWDALATGVPVLAAPMTITPAQ